MPAVDPAAAISATGVRARIRRVLDSLVVARGGGVHGLLDLLLDVLDVAVHRLGAVED